MHGMCGELNRIVEDPDKFVMSWLLVKKTLRMDNREEFDSLW